MLTNEQEVFPCRLPAKPPSNPHIQELAPRFPKNPAKSKETQAGSCALTIPRVRWANEAPGAAAAAAAGGNDRPGKSPAHPQRRRARSAHRPGRLACLQMRDEPATRARRAGGVREANQRHQADSPGTAPGVPTHAISAATRAGRAAPSALLGAGTARRGEAAFPLQLSPPPPWPTRGAVQVPAGSLPWCGEGAPAEQPPRCRVRGGSGCGASRDTS